MNSESKNLSSDDLDRRLSAVARRAAASAAGEVDVEGDLAELHHRLEARDPSLSGNPHPPSYRRRTGVLVAAVAIVIVGVAAMVLVVRARGEDDPTVPATLPKTGTTLLSVPVVIPESDTATMPSEPATTTTTSPATSTSSPSQVDELPMVDEADPPVIEPTAEVSVDKFDNGQDAQIWVAIGSPEGYVVAQKGADYLEIVGTGGNRRIELTEQVVPLVVLGNVLYAQGEDAFTDGQPPSARFVAIALTGPNEGSVVAESLQSWVRYIELPVGAFTLGPNGVIDQARDIGATVIDYVNENGDPVTPIAGDHQLVAVDLAALFAAEPAVVTIDNAPTYRIRTDEATLADGMNGPLPAWSGNSSAYVPVYAKDGSTLLATLDNAESSWVRIPANWQIAAQGPEGPVVVRDIGDKYEIASVDPVIDLRSQNGFKS